jgi:hypothetical protein
VGPDFVVVDAPRADLAARLGEISEPVLVETLVEALGVRVLDRLAGADEVDPDATSIGPGVERPAGRIWPPSRGRLCQIEWP